MQKNTIKPQKMVFELLMIQQLKNLSYKTDEYTQNKFQHNIFYRIRLNHNFLKPNIPCDRKLFFHLTIKKHVVIVITKEKNERNSLTDCPLFCIII